MTTMRMSKERKNELKLKLASQGRCNVIHAIRLAFNEAYKDVKHESNPNAHSTSNYQVDVVDGVCISSIHHGVAQVFKEYNYTKKTFDMTRHGSSRFTTSGVNNPPIKDAEGNVTRHQYEWKDLVAKGLKMSVAEAFRRVYSVNTGEVDRYASDDAVRQLTSMVAWLKMEKALSTQSSTGAFQLVAKRQSPRTNEHYIVRDTIAYKDTDFGRQVKLDIRYTIEVSKAIHFVEEAVEILSNLVESVVAYNSIQSRATRAEESMSCYLTTLGTSVTRLSIIEEKAGGDLDAAIQKDDADRAEILAYLSKVPNSHLLMDAPSPRWLSEGLSIQIKGLEENITRYDTYIEEEQLRITKAKSSIPKLEYELALKKFEEYMVMHDLSEQDGEEE